jgi:large subunit ribosomal protein L32e
MPSVGFITDKRVRYTLPSGFRKFLVTNERDLECLLMHNREYAAEFAHKLSGKTREKLLTRAKQLNIRVTNPNARLRTQEHE